MAFSMKFAVNPGELNRLLMSPGGDVGRFIFRVATEVAIEARQRCPVKTGHLRSSIGVARGARNSAEVTANSPYAMAVHEGTSAHVISGKPMKFPGKKSGGKMIVVNTVRNPGTKANPFLMDALTHTMTFYR